MKLKTIELPIEQIQKFCSRWHIVKLSLFGSVLRDDFCPDSDIDVLVEFQPGHTPGFLKLHRIQEEFSSLLGNRPIDLMTPKSLNHRICDRILAEAEVYYVEE
jgi:predicted nucleotidyltransferase